MADIVILNGIVVTMNPQRRVIEDGAVAITGDRITAIGSTAEIRAAHPAAKVIDATGKLVLPGLIDAHAHAGHGLIKTMGGGDSESWYQACHSVYTINSDEFFWYAEARLAALERLRFGVTTGISLLGGGDSIMRTDEPIYAAAHCQGVVEVGTRSVVAIGPTRPPHPRTYARWQNGTKHEHQVTAEQQLSTCRTVIRDWHGKHGARVNICMLTPTTKAEHLTSMSAAHLEESIVQTRASVAMAREHGLVFTQDGHGSGSIEIARDRMGILGPDCLFSHSTELTARDMTLCVEHGVKIAHNPSAIASVYGRCPAPELIDMGVTVAIGSDGTAPDRSCDMFRHMQQCMHYHRRHFRDSQVLPPGKVLEMCTIDAAVALGMEKEIGSLEVAKKADVILLDLARPHLYPYNMPLYRAVCFANGNDIATVIVDGKIAMENGKVTTVDEAKVLDDAQAATETMLERTGFRKLTETPARFWGVTRY